MNHVPNNYFRTFCDNIVDNHERSFQIVHPILIHNETIFYYLDDCFQQTFLVIPIYFIFLLYCSYQLGLHSSFILLSIRANHLPINEVSSSTRFQRNLSLFFVPFFLLITLSTTISLVIISFIVQFVILISKLSILLKIFSISIYSILIWKIYRIPCYRATYLRCFLISTILINISDCFTSYFNHFNHDLFTTLNIVSCICWIVHSLFIYQWKIFNGNQFDPVRFTDSEGPILRCDEQHSWPLQLFYSWVSPLLARGSRSEINTSEDLFELPQSLSSHAFDQSVENYLNTRPPTTNSYRLIRYIFSCIYSRLFFLAFLKFSADALGLTFPILLNQLLLYLEEPSNNQSNRGFIFATLLLLSTVLNTISTSYFNFQMSKISLQIRTILITLVYKKLFRVRQTTMMNQFGTGKLLNLANTDIERVINLVPSMFQFISLPIQLIITLYLLYTEVKFVFLSGVLFIIILIPINKFICDQITNLSQQLMSWKDKRIKIMSEVLKGIRTIKVHSWETFFIEKVQQFRKKEVKYLKYRKYLDALCVYFWATTPVIISSLVFATYVHFHGSKSLTSSKVFTTLALLSMLIMPLNALPWVLNGLMEAMVSIKRLNQFYVLVEAGLIHDWDLIEPNEDIIFELDDCSFTYSDSMDANLQNNFTLSNLNIKIFKQTLVGFTGKVGNGKSSLLKCLLNEMCRTGNGRFKMNDLCKQGIGYVPQEPWIQNTTIKENILFGREYDQQFYNQVIDACQLKEDFHQLSKGDQTLIGNHGATLSGGQKSRISLARALYQDFSVYIIDEPFASVDRNVAREINEKCFRGLLKNKCVILVTNYIEYLQDAFVVLYLNQGQISHSILSADQYRNLVDDHIQQIERSDKVDLEQNVENLKEEEQEEEEREHGTIKFSVYTSYIGAIGRGIFTLIIIFICLMQITKCASDLWLSLWTQQKDTVNTLTYLNVFIWIGVLNSLVTLIRAFIFAYGGVRAAVRVHDLLLGQVFRASTLFFDLISFGIIINRFSTDTFNVDDALPFTMNIFFAQISSLIIGLVVTSYGQPWIIIVFILLIYPYYSIQKHFRKTSREIKRISATSLSPIYSQLDDTIQGLTVIRSFAQIERFKNEFYTKVDIYNRVQYAMAAIQQWLNVRLQMIGAVVTSSVAFIAVFIHYNQNNSQQDNSSLVGLSLVYSLSLTSLLNGTVQSFTQTELDLISFERIKQLFAKLKQFYEQEDEVLRPSISDDNFHLWPNEGGISFRHVSMRYRDDLDWALNNVSFDIRPGEHVAIVGRTGSGKSSIFQSLIRLVNIDESGQILIDGIDIRTIDLKLLRSRIHIIPQDAFIFNGTIRENIDPMGQFRDEQIWTALFDCKINILVDTLGGLDAELNENGKDLSIGQRHLFCLARAVLNRNRIVCMDEITANIDDETGAIVDELMATVFRQTTILHIAHKPQAVRNYDRVIVMDESNIVSDNEICLPPQQ